MNKTQRFKTEEEVETSRLYLQSLIVFMSVAKNNFLKRDEQRAGVSF